MDIRKLAFDAQISDSEFAGRMADAELLTKTNAAYSDDKSGYGIRFGDTNDVILARDSAEQKKLFNACVANDDTSVFSNLSNGVLQFSTTVFNNKFIKQVLKTTPSTDVTTAWQQGTFGITNIFVPTISYGGAAALYTDYGGEGNSSLNINYVPRGTVILERTLQYGNLVQAMMSMGKIDYVGELRAGMAALTKLDINMINFFGYSGLNVFGLLNDPNLPAVIPSPTTGTGPSSLWVNKTFDQIVTDIRTLMNSIITVTGGHSDYSTMECVLLLPPACYTALSQLNTYGITVESYLTQVYKKMRILQVPQYQGTGNPVGSTNPNFVQLIFKEIDGQEVVYNLFTSLWNSHGLVRQPSAYIEKISYQVSGSFIALPMGIATMSGC